MKQKMRGERKRVKQIATATVPVEMNTEKVKFYTEVNFSV